MNPCPERRTTPLNCPLPLSYPQTQCHGHQCGYSFQTNPCQKSEVHQGKALLPLQEERTYICSTNRCNNCENTQSRANPRPQIICSAETSTTTMPPPAKTLTPIKTYVNSLKTQGKNKAKILQVLQMCYEEAKEEIPVISTSPDQDF